MNRYKKELLKKYTPEEIKEIEIKEKKQAWEDGTNFPELYHFMYDSVWDKSDRDKGISPLTKEARAYIRERFERGDYPERLHHFALAELRLKHSEE